ncbi:ATP-binding protein [Desulfurivibrio dismutans]|uniref:ATP-binding protein n=1 Tax=Desulfurivibrio dismutans TaxID=1398908 RepID=UPI0023DA4CE7|nr:ATP-binding protein [Desulfurivibrio alkaliphilus]MDF1615243.1 ATP-binding protein [Desulfurivibrio alkaliphilus]
MHRRKLPIGIQTFREIREGDFYYVDKTPHALKLINQGKYYFLSRPRRFGKSLFIDTVAELFAGNEPLFRGLYVHDKWDWSVKYPVIRISFGGGVLRSREELDRRVFDILRQNRENLGLNCADPADVAGCFAELIRCAATKYGRRAVVLVDEYDKPILDNISNHDLAREMRDGLRNLYSVIKDSDAHIKFAMLTGVSKFSKVSLFSGLNNLNDITLDAAYATICGYTEADVDTVFAPELPGLDRDEVRRWYNGYCWLGEKVYNPFDLLLLFEKRDFRPYWFETGTPTFLLDILLQRRVFAPDLAKLQTSADLLGRFEVNDIGTEALLFQTGYLTITAVDEPVRGRWVYTLGFPNLEVAGSLNEALVSTFGLDGQQAFRNRLAVLGALRQADFSALREHFSAFFASIPHDWYRKNELDRFEGYYASVFYSHLAALGLDVRVEESSSRGRVDLVLICEGGVYIFEFKVVEEAPEGKALAQIKAKDYAAKYRNRGEPVHLVGVEFARKTRNIVAFETARDAEGA